MVNSWFFFHVEKKNLKVVLEELYDLLNFGLVQFLKTDEGTIWFEGEVSKYNFPGNAKYNSGYAEDIASVVLGNYSPYCFDPECARKLIKSFTVEDLSGYLKKNIKGMAPHIFCVSALNSGWVKRIMKKSQWG